MPEPVYILGINAYHGDVAAALIRDGVLVAAVEEERFRRIKHWAGFPTEAIKSVLAMGGIDGRQVTHVAATRTCEAQTALRARHAEPIRLRNVHGRGLVWRTAFTLKANPREPRAAGGRRNPSFGNPLLATDRRRVFAAKHVAPGEPVESGLRFRKTCDRR